MKKTFSLLLSLAFVLAAGCSDSNEPPVTPDPPEPPTPPTEELTFEVTVETTARSIEMTVKPSDDTKTYFASYMQKEIFVGMAFDQFPESLKEFWVTYLEDYKDPEAGLANYLFMGEKTQSFTGANALPGKEFVTCVFGCEVDGTITTEVFTQPFATKELEGTKIEGVTFDISTKSLTSYGAVLNYKVGGPEVKWLSFVQLKNNFEIDYDSDPLAFVKAERDRFDQMLLNGGKEWSEYLRTSRDFDEAWKNFGSETDYVSVAVGIDENGAIVTDPSEPFYFRTKKDGAGIDIVEETEHFRFTITNLTTTRCVWAVEPLYEPGEWDYMFADALPGDYMQKVYNTDMSQFNTFASEVFDSEICRKFWYAPSKEDYLIQYPNFYQKSFLTSLEGTKLGVSFQEYEQEGFDLSLPFVVAAFTTKPDLDFDWTTFDWENGVYPRSTIGETESIEFMIPTPEEEVPESSYLPAGADRADRFHYYRMANR